MGNSPSRKDRQRGSTAYQQQPQRPQQQRRGSAPTTTQSGPRPIAGRPSDATAQIIPDQFTSLNQVTAALRRNGLESCNLIIGVDFTKSNEWSGKRTFGGRCLHSTEDPRVLNPYEDVIETIGKTLRDFDEDNVIPVFGFGDDMTSDHSVFTLSVVLVKKPGFALEEIRARYREVVPNVVMAGPTSFAPIINQAVGIVNATGEYHILVIIADGQVTRSVDIPAHAVSKNEKDTIDAITYASNFPLSIVMVGVGDGPWDSMIYFDNYLVHRKFDNFQFVDFHKITSQYGPQQMKETQFALQALMEIPAQYQIIKELNYLSRDNFARGAYMLAQDLPTVEVYPCPQPVQQTYVTEYAVYQPYYTSSTTNNSNGTNPPPYDSAVAAAYPAEMAPSAPAGFDDAIPAESVTMNHAASVRPGLNHQMSTAELELNRLQEEQLCAICLERNKDTVFQCGHETCRTCADFVNHCPTCRAEIQVRIKRFA